MTRDVRIEVRSTQVLRDGTSDSMQQTCFGRWFLRDDIHYLLYYENVDEDGSKVRNLFRIDDGNVRVQKSGAVNAMMTFEGGKTHRTDYDSMMGRMMMDIDTQRIFFIESEDRIALELDYELTLNESITEQCNWRLEIFPMPQEEERAEN